MSIGMGFFWAEVVGLWWWGTFFGWVLDCRACHCEALAVAISMTGGRERLPRRLCLLAMTMGLAMTGQRGIAALVIARL
ncbi:MAG: hypothetical protein PHQ93_01770 [Sulfurimonas sp.]|uniref:hypothetical protein n=1 Tax=Sulfurimonas sp. TaxID=2022749 RepID=UPI00262174B6|nr:hypothetical protein [Sulfurimonas sp.]MDD5399903.1 hypothetical protein [Sulfurimonas sp.]